MEIYKSVCKFLRRYNFLQRTPTLLSDCLGGKVLKHESFGGNKEGALEGGVGWPQTSPKIHWPRQKSKQYFWPRQKIFKIFWPRQQYYVAFPCGLEAVFQNVSERINFSQQQCIWFLSSLIIAMFLISRPYLKILSWKVQKWSISNYSKSPREFPRM